MLHALRAELAYFRPWVLGGLGIALGVVLIMSVVFHFVGDDGPPSAIATGLCGFFPIIAGMVVGFIAQGLRAEERRARLLLAGPLTPLHLAGVTVLLPVVLFLIGTLGGALVIAVRTLVTGHFEIESLRMVSGMGGILLAAVLLGPLAQESTAAYQQNRHRASIAGWAVFVSAILALGTFQLSLGTVFANLGLVVVGLMALVAAVPLYTGRTDFTR